MRAPIISLFVFSLFAALPQNQNRQTLHSGIDSSLRGLSASSDGKILYATGSNGVILRSPDSGKSWARLHIPDADTADFRGVQSFGADIAYVFSVGNDNKSHVYKTTDAGKTWRTQYSDPRPAFFLDGLVCRSEKDCFAISDPIDGKFPILHTEDGEHWTELPQDSEPAALPTEGLFAASNSSLILCGPNKSDILFATGGPAARVFHSADNAKTWTVADNSSPQRQPLRRNLLHRLRRPHRRRRRRRLPQPHRHKVRSRLFHRLRRHLAPSRPTSRWLPLRRHLHRRQNVDRRGHHRHRHLHRQRSPLDPAKPDNANAIIALDPKRACTAGPKGTITQLTLP